MMRRNGFSITLMQLMKVKHGKVDQKREVFASLGEGTQY